MNTYKTLVPLDGSRYAEHALAFLPTLSRYGQLEVTLVGVVDSTDVLKEVPITEVEDRAANLLGSYLHEIASDLRTHLKASVQTKVLSDGAAKAILSEAAEAKPDLLLISTHGHSALNRWQRGGVADKVIRNAECPVLVVGPRAMEKGQWLEAELVPPFKEILVPLDGSPRAELALDKAMDMAQRFGSRIHLFRVLPEIAISSSFVEMPSTLRAEVIAAGKQYIADVSANVTAPNGTCSSVTIGPAVGEIEAYIKANDIDLVVMTSHGRGGMARAALGSVADRVIGMGPPVLLVPTRK